MTDLALNGKVALVTGASRGIGLAIAQAYAKAGLALYLASPASDFATGSIFVLDGGQLVGSRVNIF